MAAMLLERLCVGILIEEVLGFLLGFDFLVEIIVHQTNGTETAAGEAFGEFDAVFPIFTDGNGIVVGDVRTIDVCFLAELLHELVAARHGATEGATNTDVVFARGALAEARVEGNDFEDIDRLET